MDRPLRIAVAEDEPKMGQFLRRALLRLGHEVVVLAVSGRELVQQCHQSHPDLIIADIVMPGMDGTGMDGIEAVSTICRECLVPVIFVSGHDEPGLIERAEANHAQGYLIKPIKQADLKPAIGIAMRRFEEFQALRQEASDLKQALEDRKVIERAKGILMKRTGLSEPDAFHRLQKLASDKGLKLIAVASMILTADEALGSPDLP